MSIPRQHDNANLEVGASVDSIMQFLKEIQNLIPVNLSIEVISIILALAAALLILMIARVTWPISKFLVKYTIPPFIFVVALLAIILSWAMLSSEEINSAIRDFYHGDGLPETFKKVEQQEEMTVWQPLIGVLSLIGFSFLTYWFFRLTISLYLIGWGAVGIYTLFVNQIEFMRFSLTMPPDLIRISDLTLNQCSFFNNLQGNYPGYCGEVIFWQVGTAILIVWLLFKATELVFPYMKPALKSWQIALFLFIWPILLIGYILSSGSDDDDSTREHRHIEIREPPDWMLGGGELIATIDGNEIRRPPDWILGAGEVIAIISGNEIRRPPDWMLGGSEIIAVIDGNEIRSPTDWLGGSEIMAVIDGNEIRSPTDWLGGSDVIANIKGDS